MEKIIKKSIIKIIAILILIIVLTTVMGTNRSHASLAGFFTSAGRNLINGAIGLIMWLADFLLQAMQYMMVGVWDLENYEGDSKIQYSPGIIFMNKVAGLKVNFISAKEDDKTVIKNFIGLLEEKNDILKLAEKVKYIDKEILWEHNFDISTSDSFEEDDNGNYSYVEIDGDIVLYDYNKNDYFYEPFASKSGESILSKNGEKNLYYYGIDSLTFRPAQADMLIEDNKVVCYPVLTGGPISNSNGSKVHEFLALNGSKSEIWKPTIYKKEVIWNKPNTSSSQYTSNGGRQLEKTDYYVFHEGRKC